MTMRMIKVKALYLTVVKRALVHLGFSDTVIAAYFNRNSARSDRETIEDAVSLGFNTERATQVETAKAYAILDGDKDDVGEFTNNILNNVLNINTEQDQDQGGHNG